MAEEPYNPNPPSHEVPKGRIAPRNAKAILVLLALVVVAVLAGLFTSTGSEDADTDRQRGGEVGRLPTQ
ncbi:hypothetical protein [Aureimonas sp. SK2]|uniref:hypothetical protein n=1 Tax=Aureimonas sp. SK2 TaxID=3015992 RepID=UPI002444745F|nr:hypothetical protein [Aureimonas sp. SK2]